MGPDGIVMTAPALDDNLRLVESVEDLAVEQLVPEPGSEHRGGSQRYDGRNREHQLFYRSTSLSRWSGN